jgi:3-phenylpropionate/trans-cinnamate dioxygenase ferredoxin component
MTRQRICSVAELAEDKAHPVLVGDLDIAIVKQGEEIFAIQDLCSHAEVALSEGTVANCTIECWLHGSTFDLRTGAPTLLPATEPVATFAVELIDGDVYLDPDTTLNGVQPA